ncbi:MAG: AraC family transcriptional regulator [Myxococcota bacterium]
MGVDFEEEIERNGEFLVGRFRCRPESPMWDRVNEIENGPLFVIPSSGVEISHSGGPTIVTSATRVVFYNRGHLYRRRLLDRHGDRCAFFRVSFDALIEAAEHHQVDLRDNAACPFTSTSASLDPSAYLLHRRIVRDVFTNYAEIDRRTEDMLALLDAVFAGLARASRRTSRPPGQRGRDAVIETQRTLVRDFDQNLSLAQLGRRVELSPYHLARSFRTLNGVSIHEFRDRVRVLHSLHRLDSEERLIDIALDSGFSSHSHFTQVCRKILGVTPSTLRASSGDAHPT